MSAERNTVGYTESVNFRCLEDLPAGGNIGTVNLITLDYCGREKCKSGYRFAPYVRENYVLHIVLEGKGQLKTEGMTYDIGKDQAFLLRPGVESVYQADKDDPWYYAWVGFHGYQCERIISLMGFSQDHDVVNVASAAKLKEYINNMMEHRELTYAHHLKRSAYLELLIGDIIEFARVPEMGKGFSKETYVSLALDYMIKNYSTQLKVSKIADMIGINRSYFAIIFKKSTGMSPQQFLVDFRMRRAAELLSETDMAVSEIATAVGYLDPMTFSKAFKQSLDIYNFAYQGAQRKAYCHKHSLPAVYHAVIYGEHSLHRAGNSDKHHTDAACHC